MKNLLFISLLFLTSCGTPSDKQSNAKKASKNIGDNNEMSSKKELPIDSNGTNSNELSQKLEFIKPEQKELTFFINKQHLTGLDSTQKELLQAHYNRLRVLRKDSVVDSLSSYKILFTKLHKQTILPGSGSSRIITNTLRVDKQEIKLNKFLKVRTRHNPVLSISSYGQKYLILNFFHEYHGNSSWFSTEIIFLEKKTGVKVN